MLRNSISISLARLVFLVVTFLVFFKKRGMVGHASTIQAGYLHGIRERVELVSWLPEQLREEVAP